MATTVAGGRGRECVMYSEVTYRQFSGDLFPFLGDQSSTSNPVFSYTPLPWCSLNLMSPALPLLPFFLPLPSLTASWPQGRQPLAECILGPNGTKTGRRGFLA
jgi:hypothetical protein